MTPFDDPPEPLPLDHEAWARLYVYFVAACDRQASPEAGEYLLEAFDSLDYFQYAVSRGQVLIAPFMKADGLYFKVGVRASDTGKVFEVTHVHSANLGLGAELLEAEVWLANAFALAKGAPDSPEGIEGA